MMREDQRPEARLASVSPVPGRAGYDDPLNSGRRSMTTQAPAELFGEVGDPEIRMAIVGSPIFS
jgi:hypothetical protein